MSFTFSRALVGEFSRGTSLGGDASAPSNTTPTPDQSWWPDKTTEHSRLSRFGMTCAPLTEDRGAAVLMWWLEASRARTSALLEKAMDWTENAPVCGRSSQGSFARYDPSELKWRTAQCSLVEGLDEFSEIWPRWGSMRSGASFLRPIPALPIGESASGSWPTPVASDYLWNDSERLVAWEIRAEKKKEQGINLQFALRHAVQMWPTPCARDYRYPGRSRLERTGSKAGDVLPQAVGGPLNPDWTEWLMGWPIGWTDLKPLATGRFREWQQQHSVC